MKIFQVDAFTSELFKGNPAAVCLLPDDKDVKKAWMQQVAAEMNLSETAFVQKNTKTRGGVFSLYWFTPKTEVDLCGHATLATAHILWEEGILGKTQDAIFETRSGKLRVRYDGAQIKMNFPADKVLACEEPVGLEMALGCVIQGTYRAGQDIVIEVENEQIVQQLTPSIQQLSLMPARCVVVTARGDEVDFVSRVFAPSVGISEDAVTGSTHCSLTPFWAKRLQKSSLTALQLSARGGALSVQIDDDRVIISGQAVTVFRGELCE